jgi:hypothetical protein
MFIIYLYIHIFILYVLILIIIIVLLLYRTLLGLAPCFRFVNPKTQAVGFPGRGQARCKAANYIQDNTHRHPCKWDPNPVFEWANTTAAIC